MNSFTCSQSEESSRQFREYSTKYNNEYGFHIHILGQSVGWMHCVGSQLFVSAFVSHLEPEATVREIRNGWRVRDKGKLWHKSEKLYFGMEKEHHHFVMKLVFNARFALLAASGQLLVSLIFLPTLKLEALCSSVMPVTFTGLLLHSDRCVNLKSNWLYVKSKGLCHYSGWLVLNIFQRLVLVKETRRFGSWLCFSDQRTRIWSNYWSQQSRKGVGMAQSV
jgi:hypothetical protein